ncbi:MAG: class I SAM-dependent methyltransferase [Candidatus Hodarchaeota archaeon]
MKCRICHNEDLIEYLDLGNQPLADAFVDREQFDSEADFPLSVVYCPNCSLSQLSYVVPPEILYNESYPYETGMNIEGIKHFRQMAQYLEYRFKPKYVVDIGSNDGTLLKGFTCKTCGIEPVKEIAEKAGVYTINDFFGSNSVDEALVHGGKADLITACNVFAHVDNLHGFMWHIDRLLADDGVFMIEAPYLPDMIDNLAFDTIYHEHLSYFSIKPLMHLFRQYNMEIFHCEKFPIHCGTMRHYVARRGTHMMTSAIDIWFEHELKYHDIEKLNDFALEVQCFRDIFRGSLLRIKTPITTRRITIYNYFRVVGVSAPAKANTLLNYCGIGNDIIDYITEKSPRKIGKFTPGTHIPIVPDSKLIEDQPDYAIIFAHNWADQIKEALKDYKGEWVIPNEKGLKDLCRRAYGVGRQCDCSGTKEKGIHECHGVSG